MQIYVKLLTGEKISLEVTLNDTIENVKEQIEERTGLSKLSLHLVFMGKRLENDRTLSEYNIQKGAIIYLLLALRGGCVNCRIKQK